MIRFLNYARELQLRGHRVYFAALLNPRYAAESRIWLTSLKEQEIIADFVELPYSPSSRRMRIAARTIYPGLRNWILRHAQAETKKSLKDFMVRLNIDLLVISNRPLFFLYSAILPGQACLIDFCDCASLSMFREMKHRLSSRQFWRFLRELPYLINIACEDRYYAKRCTAGIVVSPVDQLALQRIAGMSATIYTLLNGVSFPAQLGDVRKIKDRLIFSGNMCFPPNFTAALWFLDKVFPRVLKHLPDAQIILAGADPPEVLKARAGNNIVVTGYVEDLNREIACSALYVAPLLTGSGFKNKIAEAIANHTYVVATPLAVEFLDTSTRSLIPVAESPEEMGNLIVGLLQDPTAWEFRLTKLYNQVRSTFTWSSRAEELLAYFDASIKRAQRFRSNQDTSEAATQYR
jgi:glycosyltransferase involved in cell wall biosynthesis